MSTRSLSTIASLLNSRGPAPALPPLLYMTDAARIPNPLPAIRQLPSGSGVIFRHYAVPQKFELATQISKICQQNSLVFLVADDITLARKLDADGLHLPEYRLNHPALGARVWRRQPHKIITAAAHSANSLRQCDALEIDAALVSPVFPTESHPETNGGSGTIGALGLTKICRNIKTPVYALGGVTNSNAMQLLKSPAIGIAGIGGIVDNGAEK